MQTIRISAVSYLNSKPFIYGLLHSDLIDEIKLSLDIPSVCAAKLLNDEADIGLVPVAVLPEINAANIVTNYCIGAIDAVQSVALYSHVPLHDITHIRLDHESRTSVILLKILAANFWKISVEFVEDNGQVISGNEEALLLIGDKALLPKDTYKYVYDLAAEWKKYTGLPFVFACWVANKKLDAQFVSRFEEAIRFGVQHKREAIAEEHVSVPGFDPVSYIENNISYELDEQKRMGLELFLSLKEKVISPL